MLARFIDTPREDSLTAAVFSHLLHLPADEFWPILRRACYSEELPMVAGEPLQVDPWPSWSPKGTRNSSRVVPDLFIRFAEFDLIIEAKRRDEGMQNRAQWEAQLAAYANEYGADNKSVCMIALGGLHGNDDDLIRCQWQPDTPSTGSLPNRVIICPVHMCRWSRVLEECQGRVRESEKLPGPDARTAASLRVLHDVIELFAVHGFATGRWFGDHDRAKHRLSSEIRSHHKIFQECSRQLALS